MRAPRISVAESAFDPLHGMVALLGRGPAMQRMWQFAGLGRPLRISQCKLGLRFLVLGPLSAIFSTARLRVGRPVLKARSCYQCALWRRP